MKKVKIAIIMGSDSDLPIMQEAAKFLDRLKIPYLLTVVSAHRTPNRLYHFAERSQQLGIKVIIAAAGGAAHLPGMTAAITNLPVIGVPIKTKSLKGLDSFLSIAQMPPGVPVATVAINGAQNAAILACEILALSDKNLSTKLKDLKKDLKEVVEKKAQKMDEIGYKKYLAQLEKLT